MNEWIIREHGDKHNAHAEQQEAKMLCQARFQALDAARPCPLCGGSGEVFFADTEQYEACPEGCPIRK